MRVKATIQRLSTGVRGLDEVLGGGLPEYSFNVIAGRPGCGKTTLAHQMMFAMASPERSALYFTVLGEPPMKMLRYQQQFDFFDDEQVSRSIRFINLADDVRAGDLDRVMGRIAAEVERHGPGLVFMDSFRSAVQDERGGESRPGLQNFVQHLAVLMSAWQATTFLIGEYGSEHDAHPVFTVADGLIWLHQTQQRGSMVRKLEIVKMRGQPTLPGLHTFRISGRGIDVFAPAAALGASDRGPTPTKGQRVPMGVPGLDAMLGGGLPLGYSLLVAGPSGSGKSILAAAFLAAGARRGERGVIAAFEQHPSRARDRVVANLIAVGQVGLVDSRSPDLSIDEVVCMILDEVRRLDARLVVIDSLSGFELALAPTFREDFRKSLARLITTLAGAGLTVLLTSELEDRYVDLRFSPYGTAFLTDAIIVQRYVEIDSRLRRLMAVVKVRASDHSDALRLYSITDDGIRIDQTVPEEEGLLGGRPSRRSTPVEAIEATAVSDGRPMRAAP